MLKKEKMNDINLVFDRIKIDLLFIFTKITILNFVIKSKIYNILLKTLSKLIQINNRPLKITLGFTLETLHQMDCSL